MWLARIALQDMPCIQTPIQTNITTVEIMTHRSRKEACSLAGKKYIQTYIYIYTLNQGWTNPECQVTMVTEFHMMAPNIWAFSVRNFRHLEL